MRRLAIALGVGSLLGCFGASEPTGGLYQWVDDAGGVHYTTDREHVPDRYRSNAQHLSSERGDREAALARASKPRARRDPSALAPPVRSAPPPTFPSAEVRAERARRIAELEAAIGRDREALKDLIAVGSPHGPELATDPQLLEIAEHLAQNESALAALRRSAEP